MTEYVGLEPLVAGDLLADRAYQHLSSAILRNQLPSGTPLSVPELARRLDISRSPVREAVQRLIYDGLAEHVAHRGAVVCQIKVDDFCGLLVVREPLEGLAARLATPRMTESALDELADILRRHEAVVESGDEVANVELDTRFHTVIRTMAGNHDLDAILARTLGRAHLSLYSLWRGERNIRAALTEHRAIFDAIAAGDADEAEIAARRHISNLGTRVVNYTTGAGAGAGRDALDPGGALVAEMP